LQPFRLQIPSILVARTSGRAFGVLSVRPFTWM
jgi:hypothetical protein